MKQTDILVAAGVLAGMALAGSAHSAPASMKSRDRAIWTAIDYCVSLKGEPMECCIGPAAGGPDVWIEHRVTRMGARLVGPSWIASADRSHMVSYLEVDNFVLESPRIARVNVYISVPFESDPSAVMETTGNVYVELDKGQWRMDGSKTQMRDLE